MPNNLIRTKRLRFFIKRIMERLYFLEKQRDMVHFEKHLDPFLVSDCSIGLQSDRLFRA